MSGSVGNHHRSRQWHVRLIYALIFCFSLSTASTAYMLSSFIQQYVGVDHVGMVYGISYALAATIILLMHAWMVRSGKQRLFHGFIIATFFSMLSIVALSAVDITKSPNDIVLIAGSILLIMFAVYESSNIIAGIGFDLAIQQYDHSVTTGRTRGTLLTINSIGWVIAPTVMGILTDRYGYGGPLAFSALLIVPVLSFYSALWKHSDDHCFEYRSSFWFTVKHLLRSGLWRIYLSAFALQLFYAWMVIYIPIYLRSLGIDWEIIGIIFTIMLTAFVLIEYPAGWLADQLLGEKELLILGFIIMGLATLLIGSIAAPSILLWALILFMTRIGAALVESMNDTYFYKHVTSRDVEMIDLFRLMFPLAYIVGPITASVILIFYPLHTLFGILGLMVLAVTIPLTGLIDTR